MDDEEDGAEAVRAVWRRLLRMRDDRSGAARERARARTRAAAATVEKEAGESETVQCSSSEDEGAGRRRRRRGERDEAVLRVDTDDVEAMDTDDAATRGDADDVATRADTDDAALRVGSDDAATRVDTDDAAMRADSTRVVSSPLSSPMSAPPPPAPKSPILLSTTVASVPLPSSTAVPRGGLEAHPFVQQLGGDHHMPGFLRLYMRTLRHRLADGSLRPATPSRPRPRPYPRPDRSRSGPASAP